VHYVGKLEDGTVFDSSRVFSTVFVGEGKNIEGWELAIPTMRVGERCTLWVASEYGYGELGCPPRIPQNADLVFDIELFSYHYSAKFVQDMPLSKKMDAANHAKLSGNRLFSEGKYNVALKDYQWALAYFDDLEESRLDSPQAGVDSIKVALLLNIAACNIKLRHWWNAKTSAEQALRIDGANAKGYYRLAQSHAGLKNFTFALQKITQAIQLQPQDAALRKEHADIQAAQAAQKQRSEGMLRGHFNKQKTTKLFDEHEIIDMQRHERERIQEEMMLGWADEWV